MPLSVVSPLQVHRHEFMWEGIITVQTNENKVVLIHHKTKELEHLVEEMNIKLSNIQEQSE